MRKPRSFLPFAWELLDVRVVPSTSQVQAADIAFAATTPVQRLDGAGVDAHAAAVALADSGGASNVVFFGDSITARWDEPGYPGLPVWDASLAPLPAVAFGVDGDRTQNLIWRVENGELDGRPKVAVVEIGTNNLRFSDGNETPDETAAGITAVVRTIQAMSPDTKVLLLGLVPRGESPLDPVRGEIQQVNSLIAGLDDGVNVRYLDLGRLFLRPDGSIPSDLLVDYIHPNTDGYQLIADALQTPIRDLLGLPGLDPTTYGGPILVDVPVHPVDEAPDAQGAALAFVPPLAFDALDANPVITSDPPAGTLLPLGTTVVTITATDQFGHSTAAAFPVDVRAAVPPVLHNVPDDLAVEATSQQGAVVVYPAPTATDDSDPTVRLVCSPPSGSTFPIGSTVVVCTATDQVGEVTTAIFRVEVRDTPIFRNVPLPMLVEATSRGGASVVFTLPVVIDVGDPETRVSASRSSGSVFPIGTTVVSFSATGVSGTRTTVSFDVTVVPRGNIASNAVLAPEALARVAAVLDGKKGSAHPRAARKVLKLSYRSSPPDPSTAAAISFLTRVDSNHDSLASRKEMIAFIAANVDLNHDGKISHYEAAYSQIHDPRSALFLFAGP